MKKAIVAGHICVDITPEFPEQNSIRIDEILSPGRLINMDGVTVSTGGAVANTGLAMKYLGADVKLMGKICSDKFGDMILSLLREQGYDGSKDMIISEEGNTSYSVVIAIPGIDRIFLHSPGCNDTFTEDDLDYEAVEEAVLFHFGYPPLMKKMYEEDGRHLKEMMRKVKALGTATSLDLAAVDPASEAGKKDWGKILEEVLPFVDFFLPSVEELCFMLDKDRYAAWQKRAAGRDMTEILNLEEDIRPLADKALSMGTRIILIKCGVKGLYLKTSGKEVLCHVGEKFVLDVDNWTDREHFEDSFLPDRVLSATGAGDTCIAAFLTAMLDGKKPDECMQLASASGASCVESYDALSGLRTFDEIRTRIAEGWQKMHENHKI